jgi:hypothetical protein
MSVARSIYAVARADFFERLRRYSFLITLLFAVYLGYAAATGKVLLRLDDYRGVYTAGWIGLMVSMVTTTFVSLVGFYIVKNAIDRDRTTRVGYILAATPLSRFTYMLGKLASNFAVLTSIVFVLALGAVAMFFFAAEDRHFNAWALLSPFLLIALPAMALTASIALVFESLPFFRGGFGNVAWFFVWVFSLAMPEMLKRPWLDPLGVVGSMNSVLPAARAAIPGYKNSISLGFEVGQTQVAQNLRFSGIPWSAHSVLLRLLWIGFAILLALIAAVVFDRFDSDRSLFPSLGRKTLSLDPSPAGDSDRNGTHCLTPKRGAAPTHLTPLTRAALSTNFPQIYSAELTLALKDARWWWWAVAAGLSIAQFAAPLDVARGPLLAVAWLWPALLWSAMGARETRYGVRQLLFSCARIVQRQLPACWLAGVTIALLTGLGAGSRLALAGRVPELFAFVAALFFIPSLALFLGILTGSGKFFEAFYTLLWYVGPMNHTPGLDFTGAANGALVIRDAAIYLVLGLILLVFAFTARARQLRGG